MRSDGRMPDEMKPLAIERGYTRYAEGSVLIEEGNTRVLCTAMVEAGVPLHCREGKMGWLSAEYRMLPAANPRRRSLHLPPTGRWQEIQRLIGRSLRAAVDLYQIGEHTIWIDCCVIEADGGTRTASITGGFVALVDALRKMKEQQTIERVPLQHGVAAVSVGLVDGTPLLDLTAEEDQRASVDMNIVMTHQGEYIETQGTAEGQPFGQDGLEKMLQMARSGLEVVKSAQIKSLGDKLFD